MIQGRSNFVYRVKGTNTFVSYHLKEQYDTDAIHVDINIVDNDVLDLDAFKNGVPNTKMRNSYWKTENTSADTKSRKCRNHCTMCKIPMILSKNTCRYAANV